MKTKTITILFPKDRWGILPEGPTIELYLTNKEFDELPQIPFDTECTLTFEVPIPEPSVSITPSKLRNIIPDSYFADQACKKLFPDWEG